MGTVRNSAFPLDHSFQWERSPAVKRARELSSCAFPLKLSLAWYRGRPRPRRHCVRWRPSSPSPKRGIAAIHFSAHVYCGQMAGWIKIQDATLYGGTPWPRGHCVRWGPSSPTERGTVGLCGFPRRFLPYFYFQFGCKRQLDVVYRHFWTTVRSNGRPMLQDHSPVCNVGVLWPNGWKHQSATWYGARPWPRRPCVRWGSSSPRGQGYCSPSHFSSPCLLWPNSHPSQQLLSSCYTFLWFWSFTSHISGNGVFVFCFRAFWCFYVRNC